MKKVFLVFELIETRTEENGLVTVMKEFLSEQFTFEADAWKALTDAFKTLKNAQNRQFVIQPTWVKAKA